VLKKVKLRYIQCPPKVLGQNENDLCKQNESRSGPTKRGA